MAGKENHPPELTPGRDPTGFIEGTYVRTGLSAFERLLNKEWGATVLHAEAGECGLGAPVEFEAKCRALTKINTRKSLWRMITRGSLASPYKDLQRVFDDAYRNDILIIRAIEYERDDPLYQRPTIHIRRLYNLSSPSEATNKSEIPYIAFHGGDRESLTATILIQVVPRFFPNGFEIINSHVDFSNTDLLTLAHGRNADGTQRVTYRDATRTDIPYNHQLLNLKDQVDKEANQGLPKVLWIASVSHKTGEPASKETLEAIAKWSDEQGHFLLVDGMWKELAPLENAAAPLAARYKRMAVVDTLSTGLGMPGLGAAYTVTSADVGQQYARVHIPYELDACQRTLVDKILEATIVQRQAQVFRDRVTILRDSIGKNWFQKIKNNLQRQEKDLAESITNIRERFWLSDKPYIEISGRGSGGLLTDLVTKVAPQIFPQGFDIVGHGIQFPWIAKLAETHGTYTDGSPRVEYRSVHVPPTFSLDQALDELMTQTDKDEERKTRKKVIYVCNPNTPTGSVATKGKIIELAEWCESRRYFLITDEAWGDFLSDSNSAASLTEGFDNIVVLRSTSKGVGVPGLRVGYTITSANLHSFIQRVALPYKLNVFQEQLIHTVLNPRILLPHLALVRDIATNATRRLREGIEAIDAREPDHMRKVFYIWPSDGRVPIMFLQNHVDDLYAELRRFFIFTAPGGEGFSATAKEVENEAVRVTTPLQKRALEKGDDATLPQTYELRKRNREQILALTYQFVDDLIRRFYLFAIRYKQTHKPYTFGPLPEE